MNEGQLYEIGISGNLAYRRNKAADNYSFQTKTKAGLAGSNFQKLPQAFDEIDEKGKGARVGRRQANP